MNNIAIIGAGIAGLTVAQQLRDVAHITVFDKARGVGGRMSTRRTEHGQFDHGAQFFKARTPAFQSFLSPYIENGLVKPWALRLGEITNNEPLAITKPTEPMFVGVPAMNSLLKGLAESLDVRVGCRITSMKQIDRGWLLNDEHGEQHGPFSWVISTLPAPQALELVPNTVSFYSALSAVTIHPCFAVMITLQQPLDSPFDALQIDADLDNPLSWIAINNSKPGRASTPTLVLHTQPNWAQEHIEQPLELVQEQLVSAAMEQLPIRTKDIQSVAIHRWRYANAALNDGPEFYLDQVRRIGACGDWCINGRVEAAFTSAYQLSQNLRQQL